VADSSNQGGSAKEPRHFLHGSIIDTSTKAAPWANKHSILLAYLSVRFDVGSESLGREH